MLVPVARDLGLCEVMGRGVYEIKVIQSNDCDGYALSPARRTPLDDDRMVKKALLTREVEAITDKFALRPDSVCVAVVDPMRRRTRLARRMRPVRRVGGRAFRYASTPARPCRPSPAMARSVRSPTAIPPRAQPLAVDRRARRLERGAEA